MPKVQVTSNPKINLRKADKILKQFKNGIQPDIDYTILTQLFDSLGIFFRSTQEGILVETVLQINFQHRKGGSFTVHRCSTAKALKIAREKYTLLAS